ncbi:MAG: ABC transporter ATP-binding protein [Sphaerochaetaceae bacterium]|jgi:ABC-type uncharacterized transport system ATPase subunit|nr:ABC transporter ATP-binding protein [Sphaerochaetaceae bacterium]
MQDKYAIQMIGITKAFPGIIANDNIMLNVKENEIHALLGENGAGKSTLMSILFGAYSPDAGEIRIHGNAVRIKDPNVATSLGIGMVHQHFKLVHNYTVTQNIVLGREPRRGKGLFAPLKLDDARQKAKDLSDRYGLFIDPDAKIEDITVGQQQRVEILKTLYSDSDIIILDEPTAVLTPQEIDELMQIIRRLKQEGKTIILITHKLKEIKAVADRCSVLRRGKLIDTVDVAGVSENQLASLMVGRPVSFEIEKADKKSGAVMLSIKGLNVKDSTGVLRVKDLDLEVRSGEIMGVAGVDGNGQSNMLDAICGLCKVQSGTIELDGCDITSMPIKERIQKGLGFIPEDRQRYGLVNEFTIAENVILKDYDKSRYSKPLGVLNMDAAKAQADELIKQFDVRSAQGSATKAGSLSGGNQQKVIVAREISLSPKVLVVAQPTRGLDVGAIEYIRHRIVAERDKGRAVLLVSFELDEIMNLCDRIATISKGSIVSVDDAKSVTAHEIGLRMAGSKEASDEEK